MERDRQKLGLRSGFRVISIGAGCLDFDSLPLVVLGAIHVILLVLTLHVARQLFFFSHEIWVSSHGEVFAHARLVTTCVACLVCTYEPSSCCQPLMW